MSSRPLFWFSVVRLPNGKLSIDRVGRIGDDQDALVFVQARDEEQAGRIAMRIYQLADNRRRRKQYVKEKKCPYCGRPQDRKAGRRCSVCVEQHRQDSDRTRKRERGEKVSEPDPKLARRERREAEDQAIRLSVLEEVDDIWSTRGNIGLRQWLRKELAALRGKAVA